MLSRTLTLGLAALLGVATSLAADEPVIISYPVAPVPTADTPPVAGCGYGALMTLEPQDGAAIRAVDGSWASGSAQGLFSDDKTEHVFYLYGGPLPLPEGNPVAIVSVFRVLCFVFWYFVIPNFTPGLAWLARFLLLFPERLSSHPSAPSRGHIARTADAKSSSFVLRMSIPRRDSCLVPVPEPRP